MPSTTQPVQRTVALSAVHVAEHFNPRSGSERAEIARLAESIKTHGLIAPLVVAPIDGDGEFRLIDGERRYRACVEASVVEVPVIVRDADDATDALDVALVANMARIDLSVLEQASAFARLIDRGLTRKGVAERLGVSQKLVRERLAVLELPEELHAHVGDGTILPGAIRALLDLGSIDPGLPALAARRILEQPDVENGWADPLTWSDLAEDPVGFVSPDYVDDSLVLPHGVFETNTAYPLERFSLDEQAAAKLAEYCELAGIEDASQVTLTFGSDDLDAARKLGAAYAAKGGYRALIAGQQVADQLASDQIAQALKDARARAEQADAAGSEPDGPATAAPGGGSVAAVDEQAEREARREQREADQELRRAAVAYNDELGAAVVKHFGRLKVDGRVVKILAAVDFGGELDKIATRGARYGIPGFEKSEQLKSGKTKRTYLQASLAGTQARTFLANAGKAPGDLAGRMVALAVMARYANEDAVAQSSRSFSELDGGAELPWALDTVELIDELAAQRLPDHLLAPGREQREAQATRRRQLVENRAWLAGQLDALEGMDAGQRAQLAAEAERRFGEYSTHNWQLRDRIRELDAAHEADRSAETSAGAGAAQPEEGAA